MMYFAAAVRRVGFLYGRRTDAFSYRHRVEATTEDLNLMNGRTDGGNAPRQYTAGGQWRDLDRSSALSISLSRG
eukprot:scaffold98931_cov59-Attheya_sp.AAC.3